MYATWVHVEDLRRQGVRFLPPCVNRSEWRTTLEETSERGSDEERPGRGEASRGRPEPGGAREPAVRVGLGRVFGLAVATGERTVAARRERAFGSLADFVDRVRPTLPELEALVLAGALDFTGRSRPSLLLEARVGTAPLRQSAPAPRAPALVAPDGTRLAPEPVSPVAVPDLPEFDPAERVRGECRSTGLWFSAHPLEVLVDPSTRRGTTPAAEIPAHAQRRVTIVGLPCAYRCVETKSGGSMLFLTLADSSGLAECVLFPPVFRACAPAVRAQIVRVEGRVDEALDAVTVVVERTTALA
jgi:DNA polymerase III alpha subunit